MKIFLFAIIVSLYFFNPTFCQSNEIQWDKLNKQHNRIRIVDDEYIQNLWTDYVPLIFIDTIIVIDSTNTSGYPTFIEGLEQFTKSIKYSEIGKRAEVEGNVVVTATIDTLGYTKNLEVKLGDSLGPLKWTALKALNDTKFTPAIKNGKPVEVQIAIAFSFVLKRRENTPIDTIIVSQSGGCLTLPCSVYTISLSKNGDVTYEGRYTAERLGVWKSKIKNYEFEGIASLLYAVNFFNMKELFNNEISDQQWFSITAVTKERSKSVATDYYRPIREIILLVDHLTEKLKWEQIK
ncbi:MAG: energy transducer TonB [Ignavibacteriaceae bacterium]|nr:energy transducer TonB [Ignavibacteriaceae bacterium]